MNIVLILSITVTVLSVIIVVLGWHLYNVRSINRIINKRNKNEIKSLSHKKDDLLRRLLDCKNTEQPITWGYDDNELAEEIISDGYACKRERLKAKFL